MQSPTDFYDDTNHQQLHALDHLCGLPKFVKTAEVESREQVRALHQEAFADLRRRKFPGHSKAATWLSNAYFQVAAPLYSKKEAAFIQDRIQKFASFWHINALVDRFNQTWCKLATYTDSDLPAEKHALVVTGDDGQEIKRFPMPNAHAVKLAAEHLFANRYKYPYEWRKTAARNILREAIYYNEKHAAGSAVDGGQDGATWFEPETRDYLERASGFGISHPRDAAEKVARRVMMIKTNKNFKDHAETLAEIATELADMSRATPAQLQKLASIIDAVDRASGLCNYYHQGVEMPEEMFFDVLEKEAEAVLNSQIHLTTGNAYPVGTIASLPHEKLAEVMGSDFLDAVVSDDGFSIDPEKVAEIAPTLPRDDAMLLERVIEEVLKAPIEKGARAAKMSREPFDKESLIKKFKEEGKQVSDTEDFELLIRPANSLTPNRT